MNLDASLSLSHSNASHPRRAFAQLVWTLTAIVACTPAADDGDDIADSSSSTDAPDTDPSESSESESTTLEPGDETAADGCWDQEGDLEGFDQDYSHPFEPFACELPIPCDEVRIDFIERPDCEASDYGFGPETLENRETVEAAARCVLTAMRDATPAWHRIVVATYEGQGEDVTQYTVLDGGVMTFVDSRYDLSGYGTDRHLPLRDVAWFDACLAAPDLESLVPCLWTPGDGEPEGLACSDAPLSPVDATACIGEAPACP